MNNNIILKISSKSNPNSVAGAIASFLKNNDKVEMQAIGAGALNQAIKAVAIARGFVSPAGRNLVCVPAFANVEVEGEEKTRNENYCEGGKINMSNELTNKNTEIQAKNENLTNSERFTQKVMNEFRGNVGELNLNEYQKQLIRNYFIGIDNALKNAEASRQYSPKKKDDPTVTWNNVNMNKLATDVIQNAKLGLDMSIANHLHVVPYKNSKTNQYDLNLMPGYEGLKYIAASYSLYKVADIKVELVHENDIFQPIYKDNIEGYEFKITNPFSRGNVIGGFGYIRYENEIHNKLVVMSVDDLLKRKPDTASVEFWGGEKDKWENGKKVGKEKVEGWTNEMLYKTMVRATCKKVQVDPKKINESYVYVMESENDYYLENQEDKVHQEIEENANKEIIDITDSTEKLPASAENAENTAEQIDIQTNNKSERPAF